MVDVSTGSVVSPESVYFTPPMDAASSQDSDGDSILDLWEMQNGTDPWISDSSVGYNDAGITSLVAYQSNLNPWTLEASTIIGISGDDGSGRIPEAGNGADSGTGSDTGTSGGSSGTITRNVSLSWTPPGTREDGSATDLSEIQSYRINYGMYRENMTQSMSVPQGENSYTFEGLEQGTWYFSVQVEDDFGYLSNPSEVVIEVIE